MWIGLNALIINSDHRFLACGVNFIWFSLQLKINTFIRENLEGKLILGLIFCLARAKQRQYGRHRSSSVLVRSWRSLLAVRVRRQHGARDRRRVWASLGRGSGWRGGGVTKHKRSTQELVRWRLWRWQWRWSAGRDLSEWLDHDHGGEQQSAALETVADGGGDQCERTNRPPATARHRREQHACSHDRRDAAQGRLWAASVERATREGVRGQCM